MDVSQSESHAVHFGLKVSLVSDDFFSFNPQIIPTYVQTQHGKRAFSDKKTETRWIVLQTAKVFGLFVSKYMQQVFIFC